MINKYKVVAITPAGRRNHLEILHKFIIKNKNILDRWDLWVNTENIDDLQYMLNLSKNDSFINLVYPTWPYERNYPNLSLAPFWSKATDDDTIYIRFDDDIVFIDDNTIENLVKFRIENKNHLFIYPFIINNQFHSKNLQIRNLINQDFGIIRNYKELCGEGLNDPIALNNPSFVRYLHELFIESYHNNEHKKFMCDEKIVWEVGDGYYRYGSDKTTKFIDNAGPQVSINSVCWFGYDMKKITPINDCYFEGEPTQKELTDEEAFLTIVKTKDLNMPSCTAPNTLVVHFLFNSQRSKDNLVDILEKYKYISNV
jgi:hypothetical protein